MKIDYVDNIPDDVAAFMNESFDDYSMQKGVPKRAPFCFFICDDAGACQGVIVGYNHGADFYIRELIVSDALRGQGYGTRLMDAAEALAAERQCTRLWVDTLTYQATDFYVALGYREIARIAGYRGGHGRVFYCKRIRY